MVAFLACDMICKSFTFAEKLTDSQLYLPHKTRKQKNMKKH